MLLVLLEDACLWLTGGSSYTELFDARCYCDSFVAVIY